MRVFQVQDDWSMDNLRLADRPEPQAGPGQIILRMKAASLNFRDLLVPKRGYGKRTGTLPLIPISDGVGEVVAVGDGVTRTRAGERVCPIMIQGWIAGPATADRLGRTLGGPLDGVMTELMAVDAEGVVHVPAHLDDVEAAALPCAAVTAWSAVVTHGGVHAGQTVLVQGCGGVSLFALQFAKLHGARVIALSSSDERLERARALGADVGINYRSTPDWGPVAREHAGGDGVDHIVEVGGTGTLPQSLRAIRAGGVISLIGVLSGGSIDVSLGAIVTRHIRLQGITVGSRDDFEAMLRAIADHRLKPAIDRVFPFDDLRPALDYLATGRHIGKVCIRH